jgi:hypothetical protein
LLAISKAVIQLQTDVTSVKKTQTSQDTKIDQLEGKILKKTETLHAKILTKLSNVDKKFENQEKHIATNSTDIDKLKSEVDRQRHMIKSLTEKMDTAAKEFTESTDKQSKQVKKALKEAKLAKEEASAANELANSIEAHSQRWAIRIVGLPAPGQHGESSDEAKNTVCDFLENHLDITDIYVPDIDCAHRVGEVMQDKTQMMLVRFHARDDVAQILHKRRILKGSPLVIYEDCTYQNRQLLKKLKNHPDVESAWTKNGQIWAIKRNTDRKIKFNILDNIDTKLQETN